MKFPIPRSFLYGAASVLAMLLSSPGTLQGAVVGLNPVADAFVATGPATNNLTSNNYGAAGALALSAAGLPKGEFQSVLRFDTSGAKSSFDSLYGVGGWSLQSVTLQLTAASPNNALFNANSAGLFGVSWMQNDGWTEGTGNPNAPATSGISYSSLQSSFINPSTDEALGTFTYNGSSSGSSVYTLTLSSGLMADMLAGDNLSLRLLAADGAASYFFDSRSFGTATSRPLLGITAVPEPEAATLLALGGLFYALHGVVRCRRSPNC